MKVYVERRMKGYAYSEGKEYEMPNAHAEDFIDSGRGYEVQTDSSTDYSISELRGMDLSDKDESFFEGDKRSSIEQFK